MVFKTYSSGQIASVAIPAGWEEAPEKKSGIPTMGYKSFHPKEAPQAELSFFYRGRRISKEGANAFKALLKKAPHVLSPGEFYSLKEILRDKSDPQEFAMLIAKTEEFNGKSVLVVEGRYLQIQEENRSIILDADGEGTAIQEIFFQAPKLIFPRYYRSATAAMRSIAWRSPGN